MPAQNKDVNYREPRSLPKLLICVQTSFNSCLNASRTKKQAPTSGWLQVPGAVRLEYRKPFGTLCIPYSLFEGAFVQDQSSAVSLL